MAKWIDFVKGQQPSGRKTDVWAVVPTQDGHGNQGFPAGTICAVVYQRSLDEEQREAMVQD